MYTLRYALLFVVLIGWVVGAAPVQAADGAEEKAMREAENWLVLVDAGRYGDSWEEADKLLKDAVTKSDFERAVSVARSPLGAVVSRDLASRENRQSLPGAPDGEYVVIQYKTVFENKKSAVETITPKLGSDGRWRVSGYYVR
jgi:hypothetical protein